MLPLLFVKELSMLTRLSKFSVQAHNECSWL